MFFGREGEPKSIEDFRAQRLYSGGLDLLPFVDVFSEQPNKQDFGGTFASSVGHILTVV